MSKLEQHPGVDDLPPSDDEGSAQGSRPVQRPMEVDAFKYAETGRVAVGVGPDRLPVIQGEPPPAPDTGWTDDNLVCTSAPGRPRCKYYGALLLDADGVASGFDRMHQIRRFCTRLATGTELFEIDINIHACLLRSPADAKSGDRIDDFEARQKDVAAEMSETSDKAVF